MYADFEDTIDIKKEFPSIVNTSNEPKIDKRYNDLFGYTNKVGSLYVS